MQFCNATLLRFSLTETYVFGPIGQAALLTKCHQITDDVFLETANVLAGLVPESTLESGMLFPTISEMKVGSYTFPIPLENPFRHV